MRLDRRNALGAALGIALAAAILAAAPRGSARRSGPALSDADGALRDVVVHYLPGAADVVVPVYRDFLAQLPTDVTVHVVVPDEAAFADLAARLGPLAPRLHAVVTDHAITAWSRDRWLALAPLEPGQPARLLLPRGENGADLWPARAGDARVGLDLATALPDTVAASRSGLWFDGGDFVADGETVFVTPAVIERNLQVTALDRPAIVATLEQALGKRVVVLDGAPPHHAGMYLMLAGEGRAVVGDPSLATAFRFDDLDGRFPGGRPDLSPESQARFDAVARGVAAAGYRVTRIPVVPGADGRTWLTPLNAVLDQRGAERVVYMPVYAGADALNEAAAATWRGLGFTVRTVDCTTAYVHFGSLRCLVNVLARG